MRLFVHKFTKDNFRNVKLDNIRSKCNFQINQKIGAIWLVGIQ